MRLLQEQEIVYGGICGQIASTLTISDCVNKSSVSGNLCVGGIAGIGYNCTKSYNEGAITATSGYAGGIFGSCVNNTISYCYNKGNINGYGDDGTGFSSVGGIVGVCSGNVIYCYNRGNVYGALGQAAGIDGNSYGVGTICVQYCYNTGAVSGGNRANGSILGEGYNAGINYCYWTTSNSGIGYRGSVSNSRQMTDAELKAYTNDYFIQDTKMINDGYPIFEWQLENIDE